MRDSQHDEYEGWLGRILPLISAIAVFLMVYVIMPRDTKLVRRWLYR